MYGPTIYRAVVLSLSYDPGFLARLAGQEVAEHIMGFVLFSPLPLDCAPAGKLRVRSRCSPPRPRARSGTHRPSVLPGSLPGVPLERLPAARSLAAACCQADRPRQAVSSGLLPERSGRLPRDG